MRIFFFVLLFLLVLFGFTLAKRLLVEPVGAGVWRLAWAVSAAWLGLWLLLMVLQAGWDLTAIDAQAWATWGIFAVIPNAIFWLTVWVLRGYRRG